MSKLTTLQTYDSCVCFLFSCFSLSNLSHIDLRSLARATHVRVQIRILVCVFFIFAFISLSFARGLAQQVQRWVSPEKRLFFKALILCLFFILRLFCLFYNFFSIVKIHLVSVEFQGYGSDTKASRKVGFFALQSLIREDLTKNRVYTLIQYCVCLFFFITVLSFSLIKPLLSPYISRLCK